MDEKGDKTRTACYLHLADCLERMKDVEDASVDLVLSDLPYGTTNCRWDSCINLERLWAEYLRIGRGAFVLFAQTPFDKVLGMSQIELLRYEWIWEKTAATGHLNAKKMPMKAHENILVFYKKLPTYNPEKTTGHNRKSSVKRRDKSEIYGSQQFTELPYDSTERFPRSVQIFASDKQKLKLHPTQKPVDLCRFLIRTYTHPGDTVLDSCMGSGTTGAAALLEGRNFIGIENDPVIFEIAESRLRSLTPTPKAGCV
ncbi:MAG: site-specific DNA-methyltransferase [Roseobacter sp.]